MPEFGAVTTKLLEIVYPGGDASRRRRMAYGALHLAEGESGVEIGCGNGLLAHEIARSSPDALRRVSDGSGPGRLGRGDRAGHLVRRHSSSR
ncbi:MAG: hypothetical protein AAFU49_19845 [Pseudomonadota bacterium]